MPQQNKKEDKEFMKQQKEGKNEIIYEYQQMDYIEMQKTQNSQLSIEEQEPSWSTNTT